MIKLFKFEAVAYVLAGSQDEATEVLAISKPPRMVCSEVHDLGDRLLMVTQKLTDGLVRLKPGHFITCTNDACSGCPGADW